MKELKGVGIGAGYFAGFQYRAWNRIPGVKITAMCNRDISKAETIMQECGIPNHYTNYLEMLDKEQPDFVDIITPPETHLEMCQEAAKRGINVICQKPLAPSLAEAIEIVNYTSSMKARFMVHENWRFQPWYREMKKLIEQESIGKIHSIYFRSRMGDGWGDNAYIPRQPYFRTYPRFLVYENGIHFIDTFRYLLGEVEEVYATLRKLNPVIKGEDTAHVHFMFENGSMALWDANRYNEPNYPSPRYTFGECLLEGLKGSIRLYGNGKLTIQKLGEQEKEHPYHHENKEFAGDCVYITQKHFIDNLRSGNEFETNGNDYLKSLRVQEAIYISGQDNRNVNIKQLKL
ncbi:MAG: Gfo/Idh/MocA family protein [Bacteroidota bacterium]